MAINSNLNEPPKEDKSSAPKVSFIWRFHCNLLICNYLLLHVLLRHVALLVVSQITIIVACYNCCTFHLPYRNLLSYGLEYGNCNIDGITRQPLRLWMFLFIISKVLELGDTLFIVLRKSQLNFLHWYHHVTVLVYCWYTYPILHEIGNWFGGLNYLIHTIMYSYYAFRSMGLRLPPSIAKLITVLQILQMFVGTFLNIMSLRKSEMFDCEVQHRLAYFGLGIYTTYMILFLNYFFQRYVRKTK